MEEYTQTPWPQGLSTEYVTEDKVWVFLFYKAHWAKSKQGGRLKYVETIIYTSNVDTKYSAAMLRRSLTGTIALVESRYRSQFLGYSRLNQYLCACLNFLKKPRYSGQSVISTEIIKSEIFV